ncbi:hypothetical protein QTP70_015378 [Hemibagrus guttatus]|uniref:non-specific serine/threonine protein kinase n=1 Tax=Hemibagrus guttatus TaxID=175788 RepID=A0AAE0QQG4_9TELE|nr:hypothetical protein QTP70_015378 [Hemibagrus guttatus]
MNKVNSTVMITTVLLMRNLRRQLECVMNHWCAPLGRLLDTVSAENEQRKAVVKKGDDFSVRRCFNAGNICAPRQFSLVGCQWLFKHRSVLNNSLSLTSRIGQPCFQNCKRVVKTSFEHEDCTPQDEKGPNKKKAPFRGPLMSDKMEKDDLIRFIQGKYQECFQQLNDPDQQMSYFFWLIMELFYKRNGKVMMVEIATVIFKGYRDVRGKLGSVPDKYLVDLCLPLADLLCSNVREEEKRNAVVEMGDDLVSRGRTYAGHICYVVARVELGSRKTFDLIGYNRVPIYQSVPQDVMERTEVYEHAMSLTSGIDQPRFQSFKYLHALKLAMDGHSDQVLEYCEGMVRTIFTMPRHISSYLTENIKLSIDLLRKKAPETEWLLKLCRLLRDIHAFLPAVFINREQPRLSQEFQDTPYTVGELLGKGKCSAVYAGVRKADGRPVALKYVTKTFIESFLGTKPREAELMEMVSKQLRCENVVELLECLDVSTSFVLVLERPSPCVDLQKFCEMQRDNRLSEDVAREIMRQVVQAVGHCMTHGVFHGDLHSKNILVNPDTLEVKLIDFGHSYLVSDFGMMGYSLCIRTLGLLLAEMICGNVYIYSLNQLIKNCSQFVSPECCQLLFMCLTNPMHPPTFNEVLNHNWFRQTLSSSQAPEDPGSSN